MKVLQKTDSYTIYQKRSGRHAVKGADSKWVNGEDKVKVLLEAGLIKAVVAAEPEPAAEQVEPAEDTEDAAGKDEEQAAEEEKPE